MNTIKTSINKMTVTTAATMMPAIVPIERLLGTDGGSVVSSDLALRPTKPASV